MKISAILPLVLFFVSTLRAEDVVDNLTNPSDGQLVLDDENEMAAQAFTTGPKFTTLDSITVRLRHFLPPSPPFGSSTASIELRADDNDNELPGAALELVGTVSGFANDDDFTVNSTTNTLLHPDTRYWIVVSYDSGDFDWLNTADGSITPASTGTLPEMRATSTDGGAGWTTSDNSNFQKMKVVASPVPGITVTNTDDNKDTAPVGSLRKAIADAAEGATIDFDQSLSGGTIVLDGEELVIDKSLIIDASALPGGVVIDGNEMSRVLKVDVDTIVTLDTLTITGGRAADGGDGSDGNDGDGGGGGDGGGISNSGELTLNQSTVSGNRGGDGGVGGHGSFGGSGGSGGGIRNSGELTLNQSTVSGNRGGNGGPGNDGGDGGGISNFGELTLNQSTVSGNRGGDGSNGGDGGDRGGIAGGGANYTVFLHNSIVAGNFVGDGGSPGRGPDFGNDRETTATGINLIGDNTLANGSASTVFPAGPTVGTGANPLDPLLGPLADNGGPTLTMLPLRGSPALNATGLTDPGEFATDQRGDGFARIVAGVQDIGSVEAPDYAAIDAAAAAAARARAAKRSRLSRQIRKFNRKLKIAKRKKQKRKIKSFKKKVRRLKRQIRSL